MTHCWSRDSQVFVGDESFLSRWSSGGLARLGGILTESIKNELDGTFSIETLKTLLEQSSPMTDNTLVCVENPHCRMGGRVIPLNWIQDLVEFCKSKGILLHMDGARLMNASLACGKSLGELVKDFDSSTFCLNKALGCPMGSVLVGSSQFIERAKRIRSLLGGTMHQAGIFAAAAIHALESVAPKLQWDHANARAIAQSVFEIYSTAVTVNPRLVQTNIVHLHTDNIRVNAKALCERLEKVKEEEYASVGGVVRVLATPINDSVVRLVTHFDLSKRNVQTVIQKLSYVISEYDNMLNLNLNQTC